MKAVVCLAVLFVAIGDNAHAAVPIEGLALQLAQPIPTVNQLTVEAFDQLERNIASNVKVNPQTSTYSATLDDALLNNLENKAVRIVVSAPWSKSGNLSECPGFTGAFAEDRRGIAEAPCCGLLFFCDVVSPL